MSSDAPGQIPAYEIHGNNLKSTFRYLKPKHTPPSFWFYLKTISPKTIIIINKNKFLNGLAIQKKKYLTHDE